MSTTEAIRVLLVDDHAMVRKGLGAFLLAFEDLRLAGEAESGEQALEVFERLQPNVVLMDMMLPGMDGIATTRAIRQRFPEAKIIALTTFRDDALVPQMLQAGAIGFLLKNISADELAAAIRAAHAGRPALAPEAMQALVQASRQPPAAQASQTTPSHELTQREREVLALMVKGLNNGEIAERLVVSPSTVKAHVSNILGKLGAATRTEAVAMALQHHLI